MVHSYAQTVGEGSIDLILDSTEVLTFMERLYDAESATW